MKKRKVRQQVWLWKIDAKEVVKIQSNVSTSRACRVYKNFDGHDENAAIIMLPAWVNAKPIIAAIRKQRERQLT